MCSHVGALVRATSIAQVKESALRGLIANWRSI